MLASPGRVGGFLGYGSRMNEAMPAVGATATVTHQVTDADLARTLGTGEVPVLASSRLLTWAEGATCAAIGADLGESRTSVGTRLELQHQQPSPLDATVVVRAELTRVDGRLLVFDVHAEHDDGQVVGRAEVSRVVVDRDRFLKRVAPGG
jgi:fluoroacetyl-CoA thioesterase